MRDGIREADRRRWAQAKYDRQLMDETGRWLRHRAVQDHYAGLHSPEVTFALACIFDGLALHWHELPSGLRGEIRSTCEVVWQADVGLHPPRTAADPTDPTDPTSI